MLLDELCEYSQYPKNTMSIDEFITYANNNKSMFINYLEALMDVKGNITLVSPSHSETIMRIAAEIEHTTVDEIRSFLQKEYESPVEFYSDKHNIICIWYEFILVSSNHDRSPEQSTALSKLTESGLLPKNYSVRSTDGYSNYIYRKGLL